MGEDCGYETSIFVFKGRIEVSIKPLGAAMKPSES